MRLTIRSRPGVEIITMARVDDLTPARARNAKKFWGLYECSLSDGKTRYTFGEEIEVQA